MRTCRDFIGAGLLTAMLMLVGCDSSHSKPTIMVGYETLDAARSRGFDYERQLALAEHGNHDALVRLLRFSPETDAAAALGHATVLVKLLQAVGDERFAEAASDVTEEVRAAAKHLLEGGAMEMQLAQPLHEQYPQTFGVLDRKP
jgi:hypothetical protein